jgi:DNA-binding transcriptional MerR regulator
MIQDKLTIKQFADMCSVEKRTLYYYDEIDLLKPIETKENGYRVYSSKQFDTMSMIKALQSVGMSLHDIKELMNEHDLPHCQAMINNQILLIKEKQEELKMAEIILSQTRSQLDRYLEIGCNKFFIEESPDIYLITQEISDKNPIFVNYITSGYQLGVIMHDTKTAVPQFVFKKAQGRKNGNTIKTAGTYACVYQSVPNGKISETVHTFMRFLSYKQMITEGPLYLEGLASDFVRFPNQEYIFKLSIKCKKSN